MVLITRPPVAASELADALSDISVLPIVFPTIAIEKILISPSVIQQLKQAEKIIVTSRHAVESLATLWSRLKDHAEVFALGEGTALALQAYDITAKLPTTAFSSEGILALPALQKVSSQAIAIVSGEGGRQLLTPGLSARGARIVEVVGYRRILPKYEPTMLSQIKSQPIDLIISTSDESLLNLFKLYGEAGQTWLQNCQYCLLSARMHTTAKDLGIKTQPLICQSASMPALVCAVKAWYDAR